MRKKCKEICHQGEKVVHLTSVTRLVAGGDRFEMFFERELNLENRRVVLAHLILWGGWVGRCGGCGEWGSARGLRVIIRDCTGQWVALDMRDYCFAMKSLSLGIVRTSGALRGACVRDYCFAMKSLSLGIVRTGGAVRGLALGIEPTSFFVVGGERSACSC
ncbi:MAG: hypothetical protein LBQ31_10440 [Bacteroidales bacterium]|nr:hypothetical protein [Bacteroidales bacterium]